MILQSKINALGRHSVLSVDYYCLECRRIVQLARGEEAKCPVCGSNLIPGPTKACGELVAWVDGDFVWR